MVGSASRSLARIDAYVPCTGGVLGSLGSVFHDTGAGGGRVV